MVRLLYKEPGRLFRRCSHSENNGSKLQAVDDDTQKDGWRESVRDRTGYDERGVPICHSSRPDPYESCWPYRTSNRAPAQNPSTKFARIPANPRNNPSI